MTDAMEFEPEFYEEQNRMMSERFKKLFSRWKLNWNAHIKDVDHRLRNKLYWKWVYLCGMEKFVQEHTGKEKNLKELLEIDSNKRIGRIIGDYFKIENYLKEL